jgi:hypothetical protein
MGVEHPSEPLPSGNHVRAKSELRGRRDSSVVDVIVQFTSVPGPSHRNKISQHGGYVKTDLHLAQALRVSIPASRLADLARDPGVAYISPNRQLESTFNNSTGAVLAQYAWANGLDLMRHMHTVLA